MHKKDNEIRKVGLMKEISLRRFLSSTGNGYYLVVGIGVLGRRQEWCR